MRIRLSECVRFVGIAIAFLVMVVFSNPVFGKQDLEPLDQETLAGAVAAVQSSLVRIETIGGAEQVDEWRITGQPSTGIIVGEEGFVVTAAFNLMHDPTAIFVTLASGQRVAATVVARNESRHVVLLQIDTNETLQVANILTRQQLTTGQAAIALGRSMDLPVPTISTGIVSATDRVFGKAIQTDAMISPNNYGGPLVDLEGSVMGILVPLSPRSTAVTAGVEWYDSGVGFAIPLDELRLEEMVQGNNLMPGLLGASFKEDAGNASRPEIAACPTNGPAAKAGLKSGDMIVAIDDRPVSFVNQLKHELGRRYSGDELKIDFVRDGEKSTTSVSLIEKLEPWRHAMLGVMVEEAGSQVIVQTVLPNSKANTEGIVAGDIIIEFEGVKIVGVDALESELMKRQADESCKIAIMRDGEVKLIDLQLDKLNAELIEIAASSSFESGDALVKLEIPEFPNECHGYFPVSTEDATSESALLVWIASPGNVNQDSILADWSDWCDKRGMALLIIESADEKSWKKEEVELVGKIISEVNRKYSINADRIAVGGQGIGGVMASVVAREMRETFRGLVLVDTKPSRVFSETITEPIYRQLVLLAVSRQEDAILKQLETARQQLTDNGIPSLLLNDSEALREKVAAWIDTLGRY